MQEADLVWDDDAELAAGDTSADWALLSGTQQPSAQCASAAPQTGQMVTQLALPGCCTGCSKAGATRHSQPV